MNPKGRFRGILLILWKNYVLRKRRYVITTLEVFCPACLILLVLAMRLDTESKMPKDKRLQDFERERLETTRTRQQTAESVMSEESIFMERKDRNGSNVDSIMAYTPEDTETTWLMKKLRADIGDILGPDLTATGFKSEDAIEMFIINQKRTELKIGEERVPYKNGEPEPNFKFKNPKIAFAIILQKNVSSNDVKFSYKIRFLLDRDRPKEFLRTDQTFRPREDRYGDFFDLETSNSYLTSGFTLIQIKLDKILIQNLTSDATGKIQNISIQSFPFPSIEEAYMDRGHEFESLYSMLLILGFMFIIPTIMLNVVSEKQSGIKELMKMMGLPNWMHWLGWMLNSLITHIISITMIVILLYVGKYPIIGLSDPSVVWVSLLLYLVSATAFLFFISVFFQRPMTANNVAIIVWIVTYFVAINSLDGAMTREYTLGDRMATALFPNYAFVLFLKAMSGLEAKGLGAQWRLIAERRNKFDPLTIGHSWLMFIVDTIFYMALTIYLENVIPSQHGIRKSWYYIFMPSTWGCSARRAVQIAPAVTEAQAQDETLGFEAEPEGLTAGIVVRNLSKRFGAGNVVVNGVSFKMFDGQITVLLGQNGAGKTTTLSILTGLTGPSSGTAIINGYDINTQMDDVQSSLGFCPKYNPLFDYLNVEEHFMFFCRLKGMSKMEAQTETTLLLDQIKLSETRYALSKVLTAGQKRKLSLGIALIGRKKVLILDEPTSTVDPEARRAIWDILLGVRGSGTILLTTNFMEEANILGDRIAIMAGGKLECCGTPAYLKKFYGVGYTLTMSIEENSNREAILTSVQNHVPSAFLKFQKSPNATEASIALPTEGESITLFQAMLTDLTKNKETLGIRTMSLSLTTMDDIFVKEGELTTGEDDTNVDLTGGQVVASPPLVKVKGCQLILQQFWGLLLKRILYTLRQPIILLLQFVVPLLIIMSAISQFHVQLAMNSAPPALTMNLSDYSDSKTLYRSSFADLNMSYPRVVGTSASYTSQPIVRRLSAVRDRDEGDYIAHYIVAAEMGRESVTAMFSGVVYHASPLSVNLISNAILRSRSRNKRHSIEVTNHPFYDELGTLDKALGSRGGVRNRGTQIVFGIVLSISLSLFAVSFIIFPAEEKLCQAKHLQLMTGVSPLVFWGSSFLWDFFLVVIFSTLMVACLAIFEADGLLTVSGGGGVAFLILLTFGFTAIPSSYLASLYTKSVLGGYILLLFILYPGGLMLAFLIYWLEGGFPNDPVFNVLIRVVAFVSPNFGATISMMKYSELALYNSRCSAIPQKYKKLICEGTADAPLFPYLYLCCATCKMPARKRSKSETSEYRSAQTYGTCFKQIPYLIFTTEDPERTGLPESIPFPGIGQELLYLFLLGVLYHIVFLWFQYKALRNINQLDAPWNLFPSPAVEQDVVEESNRVQYMIQTGRVNEDALVVENLSKRFGFSSAVAKLSFGVHYGECFGILGASGAGKTTTLRMLTGDEMRSIGNAFGLNYTLEKNRTEFLKNIGYCPQDDGFIGVLTGREALELYGRLRGVPGRYIKSEANKWLSKMGLLETGNVKCKNYSGGMKRRLSAGVALIGDPKIILLDEPTSGVDPVSCRNFWKVLAELRDQGQSIILTSHSLEECEAVCSRLAIMVNGQFVCFGEVEHLKSRYAQGFSLTLKVNPLMPVDHPGVLALQGEISLRFQPCVLKDQHENVSKYQLNNYDMPWDVIFQIMADLRIRFQEFIEDCSVIETTLEEVYKDFVRLQNPPRVVHADLFTKMVTCKWTDDS